MEGVGVGKKMYGPEGPEAIPARPSGESRPKANMQNFEKLRRKREAECYSSKSYIKFKFLAH